MTPDIDTFHAAYLRMAAQLEIRAPAATILQQSETLYALLFSRTRPETESPPKTEDAASLAELETIAGQAAQQEPEEPTPLEEPQKNENPIDEMIEAISLAGAIRQNTMPTRELAARLRGGALAYRRCAPAIIAHMELIADQLDNQPTN